jgi:hypothetical protein
VSKRRTRKDKENAKHRFVVTWTPRQGVNRQIKKSASQDKNSISKSKNAETLAKDEDSRQMGKRVVKSLALALVIVLIELVIYLAQLV